MRSDKAYLALRRWRTGTILVGKDFLLSRRLFLKAEAWVHPKTKSGWAAAGVPHALSLIQKASKAGKGSNTSMFYSEVLEEKCDDDPATNLDFDDNQLNEAFRSIFGVEYVDNNQTSLD